ncbi:MAG: tetratricopeptide repeat protein [Promethearchaeota archaeon]
MTLEPFTQNIISLFPSDAKYSFLVGAGVSMNPPSNLPSARTLVKQLLTLYAPIEEVDTLFGIENLRYEMIVEQIQELFDPNLKFLDYFDLIIPPNPVHLFLSKNVVAGHDVLTTNFDYFLERSLQILLPMDQHANIFPVITIEDFLKCTNIPTLHDQNKYPIYKIHGSKRNLITGADTFDSLVTTMKSLGKGREHGVTFAIEPFKKPAIINLWKNRTLVVIGYSGSDDFDIGPLLQEMPVFSRLIWIDHINGDQPEVFRIITGNKEISRNSPQLHQLLFTIGKVEECEIYLIRVNTQVLITHLLWPAFFPGTDLNDLSKVTFLSSNGKEVPSFQEYMNQIYTAPDQISRYFLALKLYGFLGKFDAMLRSAEAGLKLIEQAFREPEIPVNKYIQLQNHKMALLRETGRIYLEWGKYDEALTAFQKGIKTAQDRNHAESISTFLNFIGRVYDAKNDLTTALAYYKQALEIAEKNDLLKKISTSLNNIATIYHLKGDFENAIKHLEQGLLIEEKLGDLQSKMIRINNMAQIFREQGKYEKALQFYEEALKIAETFGDLPKKASFLYNIGGLFYDYDQKNISTALKYYSQASQLFEQLNMLDLLAECLKKMSNIYSGQDLTRAISTGERAIQLFQRLKKSEREQQMYNEITFYKGLENKIKGNFEDAAEKLSQVLDLEKKSPDINLRILAQVNLGDVYVKKGDINTGLEYYHQTLRNLRTINEPTYLKNLLLTVGNISFKANKWEEAIRAYSESAEILRKSENKEALLTVLFELGLSYEHVKEHQKAINCFFEGLEYVKETIKRPDALMAYNKALGESHWSLKDYANALKYLEKALEIAKKHLPQGIITTIEGEIKDVKDEMNR